MSLISPRSLSALSLALCAACSSSTDGGAATTTTTATTSTSTSTTTTGQGGAAHGGGGQGGASTGGGGSGGSGQGGANTGGANAGGGAVGGAPPGCDAPATFGEVQAKAMGSCGGFGMMTCHSAAPYAGGLDLTKDVYAQLVNVPAEGAPGKVRIVPGDYAASFLYQKLTNTMAQDDSEGKPMPQGEAIQWVPPKPEVEAALRCWIQGGAKND